ncbi:MAG TPA: MurT ligase domain-containing protein [Candidatus Saccharimonadales bacterium]
MPKPYVTILGKAIKTAMKLRGGGSALPGLVVEKIDPDFIKDTLAQLPQGVVVVSGTNGKTTTTKMVVELLQGQGLKVFTNRTGSNFTRGVAAALLGEVDNRGNLDADIAVLELDEAHAVHFVRSVQPRYSLLLNVMRDQLDRFGEIDTTAKLLKTIADQTTEKVIVNREDPRLLKLCKSLDPKKVGYFGLSPELRETFPTDDDMRSGGTTQSTAMAPQAISILASFENNTAEFLIESRKLITSLKLEGIYNIYNAAAALGLVTTIIETINFDTLRDSLSTIEPAFGRGESIIVNGRPVDLVLVKNPAGFRLSLKSFSPKGYATMIAINDNYADGRDMSWLWDVDFDSLKENGVAAVTGVRAYDMALRLQYEEVEVAYVDTDLKKSLKDFIAHEAGTPKRIYCSYTAMLALRRELSKIANVENVL